MGYDSGNLHMIKDELVYCIKVGYKVSVWACKENLKNNLPRCNGCQIGREAILLINKREKDQKSFLRHRYPPKKYAICKEKGCRRKVIKKDKCEMHRRIEGVQ